MDCIFCKIANKEFPTEFVYETEDLVAFKDISPQAPVHILIIPKKHISSLLEADESNVDIFGKIQLAAAKIARKLGIAQEGFRLVSNCGEHGGQTVHHLHYHLLGGKFMGWPPYQN